MSRTVEFLFDFGSPASYLAWTQLPRIAADTDAEIVWRPILLGGIFKATGNAPPLAVPAKGRHLLLDLARFAKRYGVPMNFNPHFPINTLQLMRGAIGYLGSEQFDRYMTAMFEGIWVHQKDLGKPEVVAEVLDAAGLSSEEFQHLIGSDEVKDRLKASTEEAVKRGVFGAPSFFVGDQLYFGQDRLDFIAEALAR
ncbi:2-hydroxychromene-2-carboxylate isomerase [Pseudomonas sp. B392_1p]|uniref:2-hydroxychromene-2-carboxylate isomerase n=1 Tax=Pseudomonas sp. B392_1p TaxID=3457507 RepID=UPI003FCF0C37